jgi:glucose/arabinose dehydrogenase
LAVTVLVLVAAMAGRAGAVTAPAGFTVAPVVTGLQQPTAAAFAPDGRLFVLEKAGAVRVWTPTGGLAAEPVVTLASCTTSEMGLLGIAFDPDFARNGFLYLYHTQPPAGDVRRCAEGSSAGRRNRVVRVTVSGTQADPASGVELLGGLRTDNGNHDGGCLRVGPDGFLYVGVGDTGRGDGGPPGASTNPYARDLNAPEGKILRLTLDGRPAPGNPFLGRGGAGDLVFASGLRNPFRFAFDPRTGLLWAGDVGQSTVEEIDVVRAGDDLGWPRCEGRLPAASCPGDTVPPVHTYGPRGNGASVTGGVFYDGLQFDVGYRGDYFFGDFIFDLVWRARLDPERTAFTSEPEVFLRDAAGPVDFTVGPDGALYYVAFSAGEVVRVTQDAHVAAPDGCGHALAAATPRLVRRAGRRPAACATDCPVPRVGPVVARRVRRACGTPRAEVCAALGCQQCASGDDLVDCLAAAAASVATDAVRAAGIDPRDPCSRRVQRVAPQLAGRRFAAVARCARDGGSSCTAEVPLPRARLGQRRCRTPPPTLCRTLACEPCDGRTLGACVGRTVAGPADALVRTLVGD